MMLMMGRPSTHTHNNKKQKKPKFVCLFGGADEKCVFCCFCLLFIPVVHYTFAPTLAHAFLEPVDLFRLYSGIVWIALLFFSFVQQQQQCMAIPYNFAKLLNVLLFYCIYTQC